MAIKKYYANKDNTITNAFKLDLTTRATDANMGLSDILETFSIYGQASSTSTELERILIEFPVSDISRDRTAGLIPESGSVSFYFNIRNDQYFRLIERIPNIKKCEFLKIFRIYRIKSRDPMIF